MIDLYTKSVIITNCIQTSDCIIKAKDKPIEIQKNPKYNIVGHKTFQIEFESGTQIIPLEDIVAIGTQDEMFLFDRKLRTGLDFSREETPGRLPGEKDYLKLVRDEK